MTLVDFISSSQSARWYMIGIAAVIPDLLSNCNAAFICHLWHFSLRVPYLILLATVAYVAITFFSGHREVAVRATFLGISTGVGLRIIIANQSYQGLGLYLVFLSWFHFSEYYFTESFNPKRVKLASFMLNHSPAYNFAIVCSIIEFVVEKYFLPVLKENRCAYMVGFIMCIIGELIRKRAMFVAGPNFNHIVQDDLLKEPHTLITYDVYGFIQHPSYTGWFIFTIGTQVALGNPICAAGFILVMYFFFEDRVKNEEPALERKHGQKYLLYKKNTPRFVPYVW